MFGCPSGTWSFMFEVNSKVGSDVKKTSILLIMFIRCTPNLLSLKYFSDLLTIMLKEIHTSFYISFDCLFLFKNNIPYNTNTKRGEETISYTILKIIISHKAHTHNMCPRLLSSSISRLSL